MKKLFQALWPKLLEAHRDQRGALVTTDFLAAFVTNGRTIFHEAYKVGAEKADYKKVTSPMTSDTDKEQYGWMGAPPAMREWVDVRVYKALAAYSYELVNKHYEGTLEIDRDAFEDDKYGMIKPRIMSMVDETLAHVCRLVFDLLDYGTTGLAFDNVAFFADTRALGESANIDNILGGAYSGSDAEIISAIVAANIAMRRFESDRGIAMNLAPDTIVCSPEMEMPIRNALIPAVAGTARPEAALIKDIIVRPEIDAAPTDWYVLCTAMWGLKPLIYQERKRPEFVALDDPKSSHVFKNKTFLYGVDDRFAVGYGDPRMAIKIADE